MNFRFLVFSLIAIFSISIIKADNQKPESNSKTQEKPATLFQYPVVPDTMERLDTRSNFFVSHFWDKFEPKQLKKAPEKLENAFIDFIQIFPYADKDVVIDAITRLMTSQDVKNPTVMLQIAELAEKNMYGSEGTFQSDDAYLPFIQYVVSSKNVSNDQKLRYNRQISILENNVPGKPAPDMKYITSGGAKGYLKDIKTQYTILFFNDPDCDECQMTRLRLGSEYKFERMVNDGALTILSVYPDGFSNEWADKVKGYPEHWITAATDNASDKYDLRNIPNLYLLDKDKNIVLKNTDFDTLVEILNYKNK